MDVMAAWMEGSKSSATSALYRCELGKVQWEASDIPGQFERSTTYTDNQILVEWRTERNPLDIILIAEQSFRRFVEPLGNVIDRVGRSVSGALEFF